MTQKEAIKKRAALLFFVAALAGCLAWKAAEPKPFSMTPGAVGAKAANASKASLDGIQGVWVSLYDYEDAGLYNKSRQTFTANADAYFQKLKNDGVNTVFFHTVPCNDAIYPSKYLSWSSYMFRSKPDYDPLEILIESAHKRKISFHAWINPYRKTMEKIYNPGKQSSTDRIVNIVKEIIKHYDVDGIHFDDYFYPSRGPGAQLNNVSVSKRKAVINKMVKKVYRAVKNYDESLLFGISPAGIVDYAESLGCDLDAWFSEAGYMDYVVPQIYWSDQCLVDGKITALFTDRLNQWIALNKNDTPMYIGLGLYRGGSVSATDIGWSRKNNNIVTQIKKLKKKGCEGFVLFSASSLYSDSAKKEAKKYRAYIRS